MRRRTIAWIVAAGAGFFALRPPGGAFDRVAAAAVMPARLCAPFALPTRAVAAARVGPDRGSDPAQFAVERDLSERLERAVLRSAWPVVHDLGPDIIATPGEVDTRLGVDRDTIRVRVAHPERVRVGLGVVSGDSFVGRVVRVHFREDVPDRPGLIERVLRLLRLRSAPARPPRDAVDVALITGREERVGALVPVDQEGQPCRLVVGGVVAGAERVHLAVHTPESRSTKSGVVVVDEPDVLSVPGAADPCDGFLLGELVELELVRRGIDGADERGILRKVLGVAPEVDFESGLNQVLVLDRARPGEVATAPREATSPAVSGIWRSARVTGLDDTSPWRRTLRIDVGSRAAVRPGAVVVDGARLVGRVARVDAAGATVARISEPGFEVVALASPVDAPDAMPLVLGRLVSRGSDASGAPLLEWHADAEALERARAWAAGTVGRETVDVRLFTGSGLTRTPRGLLLGSTTLDLAGAGGEPQDGDPGDAERPEPGGARVLVLGGAGSPRGRLRVWMGEGAAR